MIGKAEGYLFDGRLEEVAIHARALTPAEIGAIYSVNIAGRCLPCGNRILDPNEQCDDGNAINTDGCEPDCAFTPESVSTTTGVGVTVTTDTENDGATPTDGVETYVRVPSGGAVTINEDPGDTEGAFAFFGHRLHIEAPDASPEVPLVLTFRIDASQIPPGTDLATIEVFKDGVAVAPCTATDASATPDPCLANRAHAGDGDLKITILTASASIWSFGLCGNDEIEAGEQCDDSNAASGDGGSACKVDANRMIPGTGRDNNCRLEWLIPGEIRTGGRGEVKPLIECTVGDPSCNFVPSDAACTFHVAMCYGVDDSQIGCEAPNLQYVVLNQPSLKSEDPADVANRAALGAAVAPLAGSVDGVCLNRKATTSSCALGSACNSLPEKRDGKCRRFIGFAPPLQSMLRCSEFASIRVPLKNGKKGARTLHLSALPSGIAPSVAKGAGVDVDKLKLVCTP